MTPPEPDPGPSAPLFEGLTYSRAKNAFWLGVASLFCCGCFAGIPAIIVGVQALGEIDRSQGRLTGKGTARLGIVLGIIGTVATSGGAAYYGQNR